MAGRNNKVNGGDLILLGKRLGDTVFKPVLCQTTLGLGRELGTIDASSKCGKDIAIDEENGTITMEGFVLKAGLTDILTQKDIEDLYATQNEADYLVGVVNPAGKSGITTYRFSGVMTALNVTANNNETAKANITITASGAIETGVVMPSGAILWDADAKASGYTFDWGTFFTALDSDLPASYQQEAELLLAPGISQPGKIAGIDKMGKLVEFTATRAGTAYFMDKDGKMKLAAANQPRVDYSTGVARLLIEGAGTNSIPYSNKFDSWWKKATNTTIGGQSSVTTKYGEKLTLITDSTGAIGQENGRIYTDTVVSVAGNNTFRSSLLGTPGCHQAEIRFGGAVDAADGSGSPYGIAGDYMKIISGPGQFQQLSNATALITGLSETEPTEVVVSRKIVTAGTLVQVSIYIRSGSDQIVNSAIYVGSADLKAGALSSYIPTSGAVGVRVADICTELISSAIMAPATLFEDVVSIKYADNTSHRLLTKAANGYYIYRTDPVGMKAYDGTTISNVNFSGAKFITSFDSAKKNIYANGVIGTETTVDLSTYQQLAPLLINDQGGTSAIRCLAVFSRRFTDQEAQTLTK